MMELKVKIREKFGRKTKSLRKKGLIPAILYGEGIKNTPLEVSEKEFEKIYQQAGESSLILLEIEGENSKKIEVLIHDLDRDPLTGKILHVDFYHPSAKKEVTAEIPIVFKGTSPAVKEMGGILVKEIQQVEVKGLPQNLPREITVNIDCLKTFDDKIQIKDLKVPQGVKILRESEEIVANVVPPRKEEEEVIPPPEEEKVEEKAEEKIEEKPSQETGEKKEEVKEKIND